MTDRQIAQARALARCTFPVASPPKRFARDMAAIADHDPKRELTPNQARWLESLCWRYRRQLRAMGYGHLVPETEPPRWEPTPPGGGTQA